MQQRIRRATNLAPMITALLAVCAVPAGAAGPADLPSPAHTVIVVLENHSASQVYGEKLSFPDMPFLKSLAQDGAVMLNARFAQTPYGRTPVGYTGPLPSRPSQPNYLYLFSGNNQGVLPEYFALGTPAPGYPYSGSASNDTNGDLLDSTRSGVATGIGNRVIPQAMRPFTTPNLGAAVQVHGGSFLSFSESLPYPAYDEETFDSGAGLYKRKHNPVINWIDLGTGKKDIAKRSALLPLSANLGFLPTTDPATRQRYRGFALDPEGNPLAFDQLPTVALVVPNQDHDAHDASLAEADRWLERNLGPYAQWARKHNSLLIITFDEDGSTRSAPGGAKKAGIDTIPTVFYGPMVKSGRYDEPIDHLNVLATALALHADLEAFDRDFSAAYTGDEAARERANLRPIRDIFGAGPALTPLAP